MQQDHIHAAKNTRTHASSEGQETHPRRRVNSRNCMGRRSRLPGGYRGAATPVVVQLHDPMNGSCCGLLERGRACRKTNLLVSTGCVALERVNIFARFVRHRAPRCRLYRVGTRVWSRRIAAAHSGGGKLMNLRNLHLRRAL